ncbi:MAG: TatD family hydrolase [Bacteroidales bacterium]|nr:TatD family hydrolase [Bacteroidales bacterium]
MDHFLIDTHAHLYLPDFDVDRNETMQRSLELGVQMIMLPNIDRSSIGSMLDLARRFPHNCFPMMGLHPTSVRDNYLDEIETVKSELKNRPYYAIGETGIDLHWDTRYINKQCLAFEEQIKLALQYELPVVIHARKSFNEIFEVLEGFKNNTITGIFHAFSGDTSLAEKITGMGFKLGIGGIVTFKKSGLDEVIRNTDLKHIVLETDSPYLAPVPVRGKRNESSYLHYIAESVAHIKNTSAEEVAHITTQNALSVFNKLAV